MHKDLKMNSINDYNLAIKEFCLDNESSTIYLAGEISHPGISDLDFVIIDNKPVISKNVRRFLSGGNVLIMPSSHVKQIKNLENLNLNLLQGKDFKIDDVNPYFRYVEILEWLPERIMKLESLLSNKQYNRQDVLLLHKSINRSIDNISKLTNLKYGKIETDNARKNNNLSCELIVNESIISANKAWVDFEELMHESNLIKGNVSGSVMFSNYYKFTNKFNTLLLYFKKLSSINCKLSFELQSKSKIESTKIKINNEFEDFICKRWMIINEIYNWFVQQKYDKGMIKYGWFL